MLCVYAPFSFHELCSSRRTKLTCVSAALFYFLINIHVFTGYTMREVSVEPNKTRAMCDYTSPTYQWFEEEVWPSIDAIIGTFIPLLILLVFNVLTIGKGFLSSRRTEDKVMQVNGVKLGNSKTKMTSVMAMLVAESVLFVLLNVPRDVYLIGEAHDAWGTLQTIDERLAFMVVILLGYVNNSINFVMYMLTGTKFRVAFRETFTGMMRSVTGSRSSGRLARSGTKMTSSSRVTSRRGEASGSNETITKL